MNWDTNLQRIHLYVNKFVHEIQKFDIVKS